MLKLSNSMFRLAVFALYSRNLTSKVGKENIPRRVVFVDTETTTDGRAIDFELGCYEIWKVHKNGMPDVMVKRGSFTSVDDFLALIRWPCRIVAHNWNYDACVLGLEKLDIQISRSILDAGGQYKPFYVETQIDGHKVQFLCNTNWYRMSLQEIGESLGVPKLSPDDGLEAYCYRDVEILRLSYFYLFDLSEKLAGVTPGRTLATMAMRIFRAGFYKRKRQVQGSLHSNNVTRAEQIAYLGGRVDTFYKGDPGRTVYKYDVNSLYPSIMLEDVPIRYVQLMGADEFDKMIRGGFYGYKSYIGLYKLDVDVNTEEFLAVDGIFHDGRLTFPTGTYTIWCWQPMAEIYWKLGYIRKCHRICAYDREPIFKEYVETLYQMRRDTDNPHLNLLYKLLMNSLYGKFGQRQYHKWKEASQTEYDWFRYDHDMQFEEDFYGTTYKYWQHGPKLYRTYKDNLPAPESVLSIAGYITARGRAKLWYTMDSILKRGGNVYMCDTDSVVSDILLPDDEVSDTELGKWKLEKVTDNAYFYSPKDYVMDDKYVIKGIRDATAAREYDQQVFPNWTTSFLHNREPEMRMMHKFVSGRNAKREEQGENEFTLPLSVCYN